MHNLSPVPAGGYTFSTRQENLRRVAKAPLRSRARAQLMRLGTTVLLALVTHTLCWWPVSSTPAAEVAEPVAVAAEVAEPPAEVAAPAAAEASCQDGTTYGESCSSWAAAGECEANAAFMLAECQLSCGCKPAPPAPEGPACEDRDKSGSCASWMAAGECPNLNPNPNPTPTPNPNPNPNQASARPTLPS